MKNLEYAQEIQVRLHIGVNQYIGYYFNGLLVTYATNTKEAAPIEIQNSIDEVVVQLSKQLPSKHIHVAFEKDDETNYITAFDITKGVKNVTTNR